MALDALTLSRIQFAWVIGWHILLPAFTLGIASYIALLEGLHLEGGLEAAESPGFHPTRSARIVFNNAAIGAVVPDTCSPVNGERGN